MEALQRTHLVRDVEVKTALCQIKAIWFCMRPLDAFFCVSKLAATCAAYVVKVQMVVAMPRKGFFEDSTVCLVACLVCGGSSVFLIKTMLALRRRHVIIADEPFVVAVYAIALTLHLGMIVIILHYLATFGAHLFSSCLIPNAIALLICPPPAVRCRSV